MGGKMKVYTVSIRSTFQWDIPISAKNKKEALEKAEEYYRNIDESDGVVGVADTFSHKSDEFRIVNELQNPNYDEEVLKFIEGKLPTKLRNGWKN